MLFDATVQIGDVGLVVLVVVKLHGGFVDIGLKSSVVVRQRWYFVSHLHLLRALVALKILWFVR